MFVNQHIILILVKNSVLNVILSVKLVMEKNIIIVYLVIEIVLHLNLTTEKIDVIVLRDIIIIMML